MVVLLPLLLLVVVVVVVVLVVVSVCTYACVYSTRGCPVAEGHKWAANVWIWNRPRPRFGSSGKQLASRGAGGSLWSWLWGGSSKVEKTETEQAEGIKIEFSNERAVAVQLFWVKEDLTEQQFGSIGPHGRIPMNTFVGHTWVVRDTATHEKIKTVTVKAGMGTAISIPEVLG